MKKIILSEEQSKNLANILKEDMGVQQMPVDKKMNKPFYVDPEKVKIVKKYLDGGFTPHDFEKVGDDGYPVKCKIITMNASNGEPLKLMYKEQLKDLLIDKFQKMFLDRIEREMFLSQVLDDWLNDKISVHGMLSKNMLSEMTSNEIAAEGENVNLSPTDKQKEAGNYKMGHVSVKGLAITIENPKGSVRCGKDKDGNEWKRVMKNHYGYFRNTSGNGKDGDAVDVFIGPHPDDFETVYVVDQKVDGEFDESKVMLGFYSKEEAKDAYLSNYDAEWKGFWKITGVSLRTFRRWLYRARKQRKPFFDYVTIKRQKLEENHISEEGYNEIKMVGRLFDEKAAMEIVEELKAAGIYAYNMGVSVYVMIEQDDMSQSYIDEVLEYAERLIREYEKTHSDSIDKSYSLQESYVVSDLDSNGWRIARRDDGMANLVNDETGEFASDEWFNWIGYPSEKGVSIVQKNGLGYNLMKIGGKILLPKWQDDVWDTNDPYVFRIIDGMDEYKIDLEDEINGD